VLPAVFFFLGAWLLLEYFRIYNKINTGLTSVLIGSFVLISVGFLQFSWRAKFNTAARILVSVLLAFVFVVSFILLAPYLGDKGRFRYHKVSDGYSVSALFNDIQGALVIPESYNGLAVTEIREKGFQNCKKIESVILPDSVTSIGDAAFKNCPNLKSITIKDSDLLFENPAAPRIHAVFPDSPNLTIYVSIPRPANFPNKPDANIVWGCVIESAPDTLSTSGSAYSYVTRITNAIDNFDIKGHGRVVEGAGIPTSPITFLESFSAPARNACKFANWATSVDGGGDTFEISDWPNAPRNALLFAIWTSNLAS
jgi:hypothetical protein